MDNTDLSRALEDLFGPHLEHEGIELVEMSLSGNARRRMLRLYVDRSGGITIGECAALSRQLTDLLDTHDPIEGTYVLEVSSPGLTRSLSRLRDFENAVGKAVRLVVDGRGVLVGNLVDVAADALVLRVGDEIEHIRATDVAKANLHFEF